LAGAFYFTRWVVTDRPQNFLTAPVIERFHCTYCGYVNGLFAYAVEIAARTEQYFCPIKHARKILGTHSRYSRFLNYGESTNYHAKLEEFRVALGSEIREAQQDDQAKKTPVDSTGV